MTGLGRDGDGSWDGPEWAAPERAERLASRPEAGREDIVLGRFCRWLVDGSLTVEEFQRAVRLHLKLSREDIQAGW